MVGIGLGTLNKQILGREQVSWLSPCFGGVISANLEVSWFGLRILPSARVRICTSEQHSCLVQSFLATRWLSGLSRVKSHPLRSTSVLNCAWSSLLTVWIVCLCAYLFLPAASFFRPIRGLFIFTCKRHCLNEILYFFVRLWLLLDTFFWHLGVTFFHTEYMSYLYNLFFATAFSPFQLVMTGICSKVLASCNPIRMLQ